MKKWISALLAAVMLLSLAACSSGSNAPADPAPQPDSAPSANTDEKESGETNASKELVIYTADSQSNLDAYIPAFEEQTGIHVEIVSAGTGELMKRIEAEAQNPLGDVECGGTISVCLPYKDYFEPYVSANEDAQIESCKTVEGCINCYNILPVCMVVNTDLIGDIEINSYADLLNPELKGKIAFCDPAASSSAFEHLVNMLYAMGGGDTEEGWDYVRKFCEQLDGKMLGGSSAVYKGVADGEYTVGLTFEQGSAQYVGAGAPVKTVYMEEGVIFRGDGVYIIKDCPNMKSAQIFLDWLTSKDVQEFMNNTQYRRTIRTDVESGDAMVPMEEINVIKDDETNTAEHKAEWLDKFKDIFTQ